jgi:uracil-DNA glycosylase
MDIISKYNYNYQNWQEKYLNIQKFKLLDISHDSSWEEFFNKIDNKKIKYIEEILNCLLEEEIILPYPNLLLAPFLYTKYDEVKVVIIGQDPYFNIQDKIPEAMGLSFSIPVGIPIPSSLKNIFNNLVKNNIYQNIPNHGNLQNWAEQGVLLMNASMTVKHGEKNSHAYIWNDFTDNIIELLAKEKNNIIFVLWGAFALKKKDIIDKYKQNNHKLIITSHPSGLSCNKSLGEYPSFMSYDVFGNINKELKIMKKKIIKW